MEPASISEISTRDPICVDNALSTSDRLAETPLFGLIFSAVDIIELIDETLLLHIIASSVLLSICSAAYAGAKTAIADVNNTNCATPTQTNSREEKARRF